MVSHYPAKLVAIGIGVVEIWYFCWLETKILHSVAWIWCYYLLPFRVTQKALHLFFILLLLLLLSLLSCFSFFFSLLFLYGLAKVFKVISVSCSSWHVWPRSDVLQRTHRQIFVSPSWSEHGMPCALEKKRVITDLRKDMWNLAPQLLETYISTTTIPIAPNLAVTKLGW